MDVCVLSLEEAGRLENWGVWPQCRNHRHIKKREAKELEAANACRFLGGRGTTIGDVSMVVVLGSRGIWSPVACHGDDGKAIMGFRTWGLQPAR